MDALIESANKLLVSRRRAAAELDISVRSVDYLIATGQLATRRIGRRRLIPRSALEQFVRRDHLHLQQPPPLTERPKC